MTLERLLGDVGPESFFAGNWGRAPLLVKRAQPNFYDRIFSLADVDELLFSARMRPGEFRISESKEGIDLQFGDPDSFDKSPPVSDFYGAFGAGKSLVLHGLHRRWPAMAVVTRLLEEACACPVTTNVYLTPANAQAYPLHYDTHDFFIFQLHGTKHWRVFEPGNRVNPDRDLHRLAERGLARPEPWATGPLREAFDLDAGDLLYIPRGFGHEVVSRDVSSLHLTVGVHGLNWYRLLEQALASAASDSAALRATVPIVPGADGFGRHDLAAAPAAAARLAQDLPLGRGVELWRGRRAYALEPVPDGYWATLERARTLGEETRLVRRWGLVAAAERRPDGSGVIRFMQEEVERPAAEAEALAFIAARRAFAVRDIPGPLGAAERAELAGLLVRKGLLAIAAAPPPRAAAAPTIDAQAHHAIRGGRPMTYSNGYGEGAVAPMSEGGDEASLAGNAGCGCQCGGGGCGGCNGPTAQAPGYVYAIGRINARFPTIDVEKELAQVARSSETASLTDREVLHKLLSQTDNAYIAREMCWVFTVGGVEAFTVVPRSGIELNELVASLGLGGGSGATNVLIGSRAPIALPPSSCAGLSLPTVIASKIYSFDVDEFVKELPLQEEQKAAGRELLDRITHLIDNVGDLDEHRTVNYLAVRYPGIYSLVVDNYGRDFSLQGVGISPASTRSQRRIVDVTFRFVSRKTDVRELYGVRVDVSGMFPFLVTPLRPVFDKDS